MANLKLIAQRSGVSTATVSYVVNNGPRPVSPKTRERVLQAIAELDYHPNAHARGLRGIKTDTLGVVFPHVVATPFENDYFGPLLGGIVDFATQRGKATMLFTAFAWQDDRASAPRLCDGRCDGFIVVAPFMRAQLVGALLARKARVVVVGAHPEGVCVDTVDANNFEGARKAVSHLIALGHRRIAIATGWHERSAFKERLEGYLQAHAEFGIVVDKSLIMADPGENRGQSVSDFRALLIDPLCRPSAVFCSQDDMAICAHEAAVELGLSVPGDVSIVGFDDVAKAASCRVPLTTIRQPIRQIGFRAAELLCERIDGAQDAPKDTYFDVELIERASTGPYERPV